MAKNPQHYYGNLCRFCTLSRFPVRKCLNIREEKKVVTGRYFARSEWESLLGFTASGLASAGNGHYSHVGNPLASAGISRKAQGSTARNYTLKGHGLLVAILHKEHTWQVWGHCKQAKKEKTIIQHRQWHGIGLSWTAHYRQEFQLTVTQEGWAVGAGLGNKTKYKRPRRCTSKKGNLSPSITPDLKPSLKFLFDFNWKITCLETGINTGPVSEAFPLVDCWLQIYLHLAGSRDWTLQSIIKQRLGREFDQGEQGQVLKSGL